MWVTKLLISQVKKRIFCPKTTKFGPKLAFFVNLVYFWPNIAIFCTFPPKNNVNKVPRWVFRYVSNKTFDFSSKKRIFCPETTKFGPNLAFLTIAGSFGALLMGWLVVVARGLYLARHLFTLLRHLKHGIVYYCFKPQLLDTYETIWT